MAARYPNTPAKPETPATPEAAGPCAAVDLLAMPGVEDHDLPLPHHLELPRAAALRRGTAACSSRRSPFTN
jgi:hypothetical protein